MKKIAIVFVLMVISFTFSLSVGAEDTLCDVYKSPLGVEIRSYSPNWTGERLVEVYEELLNNTYGEEIAYLGIINLYPGNPYGGEEEGLYHGSYQSNSFLNRKKYKMRKDRVIDLFNMEKKESIDEIAKTLSHEYGHHFTLYYLIKGENKTFEEWENTNYAKIRELAGDERVQKDYSNGHQWNITEIAAEDYVQLFGSPNAKKPKYYDDIESRVQKKTLGEVLKWNNYIFNVYPQENYNIPLASYFPALREYWSQLAGIEEQPNQAPTPATVALTQVKNLGYDKKQFVIQWTESVDRDSSQLLYTVVAFDQEQQQATPIKTVMKGEELKAVIGSAKVVKDSEIIYYSDTIIEEPKNIRVFTMDEQGNIVSSNIIVVDFDAPIITELNDMQLAERGLDQKEEEGNIEIYTLENENQEKGWLDKVFDWVFNLLGGFNFIT